MKKFAKTAAVLTALALLFGAVSCNENDDPDVIPGDDPVDEKVENVVVKNNTYGIEKICIEFTSDTAAKLFLKDDGDNEKIPAEYTVDGTKIVVTAKKEDVSGVIGGGVTQDVVITGTAEKDASKITITEVVADEAFNQFCPKAGDVLAKGTAFTENITTSGALYDALSTLALGDPLVDGTYGKVTVQGATRGNDPEKVVLEVKGTLSFEVSEGETITFKVGSAFRTGSSYSLSGAVTELSRTIMGTSYPELTYTAESTGTVTLTTRDREVRFTYISVAE